MNQFLKILVIAGLSLPAPLLARNNDVNDTDYSVSPAHLGAIVGARHSRHIHAGRAHRSVGRTSRGGYDDGDDIIVGGGNPSRSGRPINCVGGGGVASCYDGSGGTTTCSSSGGITNCTGSGGPSVCTHAGSTTSCSGAGGGTLCGSIGGSTSCSGPGGTFHCTTINGATMCN